MMVVTTRSQGTLSFPQRSCSSLITFPSKYAVVLPPPTRSTSAAANSKNLNSAPSKLTALMRPWSIASFAAAIIVSPRPFFVTPSTCFHIKIQSTWRRHRHRARQRGRSARPHRCRQRCAGRSGRGTSSKGARCRSSRSSTACRRARATACPR